MNNREELSIFLLTLFISEIPIILFTLLDFLKLKCLREYRIKYKGQEKREYPTNKEIIDALKISYITFLKIYIVPLIVLYIFDLTIPFLTMRDIRYPSLLGFLPALEWKISYMIELFITTVMSDICLYFTHRAFHKSNYLYQTYHLKHHQGYDMTFSAISHLFFDFESLMLALGGVIPMILLGTSIYIFLGYILILQIGNAIGHSGYYLPAMPKRFPWFNAKYHDNHHKHYNCNYAAFCTYTDQLFGTLRID